MNQQVSPVVMAIIIACVVVVAAVVLWRASVGKPAYPGAAAGHPTAERGNITPGSIKTPQQAAGRIPGAPINMNTNRGNNSPRPNGGQ